ncbi:CvpA family protein [Flavobacteriaceae bacterium 14752]|uniref:CvpA family protein n=1 Tax=Mesohalobacter salilacus TaxID=2491711 RepID=UPI000F63B980|nr:CvpA family protein [Flavobacteriaceae bacterium 14752]
MNLIDIIIGVILILGFYKGFKKGFVLELTALLGLILGIAGAFYLSKTHGLYIGQWIEWDDEYLRITTFLLSFLAIVIIVSLIGKLITKLIDFVALSFINKLLGGLFGLLKFGLLLSILLLLFNVINEQVEMLSEETLNESVSYPILNQFTDIIWPKLVGMSQNQDKIIEQLPDLGE